LSIADYYSAMQIHGLITQPSLKEIVVTKPQLSGGVRQQQIEKDYIISWVLWGIYNNEPLKDALIFKGGTCIKKVHIKDYRYSEDMDFTLNPDFEYNIEVIFWENNL
jgi:predicted nucleotidyltransferase component of viral defense system